MICLMSGVFLTTNAAFVLSSALALSATSSMPAFAAPEASYQTESKVYELLSQAHDLIVADKYKEAKPLLLKAAAMDPSSNSASIHAELATVYREGGEPEKAIAEAKKALKFDRNADVSYVMGLSYSDMGKFNDAIAWLSRYVQVVRDPVWKQRAQDMIRELQDDKERAQSGKPKEPHYLDEMVSDKDAYQWKEEAFPIKVYLESGAGVRGFRPTFKRIVVESLDEWCKASGKKLSYQLVDDKEKSQLVVAWTDQVIQSSDSASGKERMDAGLTTPNVVDGNVLSAHVLIQTYKSQKGQNRGDNELKATCLHELGHALGLGGHSKYVKDIMYYKSTPRQLLSLSERDRATIAQLYTSYPEVVAAKLGSTNSTASHSGTGTNTSSSGNKGSSDKKVVSLPPECFMTPKLPSQLLRYPTTPFFVPTLPGKSSSSSTSSSSTSSSSTSTARRSTPDIFMQPTLHATPSKRPSSDIFVTPTKPR